MDRKNNVIHDIHVYNSLTKFFVGEFYSIRNEHDGLKTNFFRKSEHHKKIPTNSNFSADYFEIIGAILFCLDDIFENSFGARINLSLIEIDTKDALGVAGVSGKDDGFTNEVLIHVILLYENIF